MGKFRRFTLDEAEKNFPLLNKEAQLILKGGCDYCKL